MTPQQGAQEIRKRMRALKEELRKAEGATIRHGELLGKRMSEGPYSSARLARMGHPYATRRPNPPMHPAIINRQRGVFWRSWRRDLGQWRGGTLISFVFNIDPKARLLMHGTRKMIARPIKPVLEGWIAQDRIGRLQMAMRRALEI